MFDVAFYTQLYLLKLAPAAIESPGWAVGSNRNETNSALCELGLGLSLAKFWMKSCDVNYGPLSWWFMMIRNSWSWFTVSRIFSNTFPALFTVLVMTPKLQCHSEELHWSHSTGAASSWTTKQRCHNAVKATDRNGKSPLMSITHLRLSVYSLQK